MNVISLSYGSEPQQTAELYLPNSPQPVPLVVLLHGGCWDSRIGTREYLTPIALDLQQAGLAVLNAEYRSVAEAPWPATFADIAQLCDAIPQLITPYAINPTRIALLGHSAGGHLALWASSRVSLTKNCELYRANPWFPYATFALAAISDLASFAQQTPSAAHALPRLLGQLNTQRYQQCSPLFLTPNPQSAITLFRAAGDNLVSASQDANYQQRYPQVLATTLAGGDHFSLAQVGHPQWAAIKNALLACLGSS